MQSKKTLTIPLIIVVLATFMLGFFQIQDQATDVYSILEEKLSCPASVVVNVGRAINGKSGSGERQQKRAEEDSKENFMFLLSSVAVFNTGAHLMVPVAAVLFIMVLCISDVKENKRKNTGLSRLRYYRKWCLKFLSPIQKSILNRADVYDINPIKVYAGEKSPCFSFYMRSAGFFYAVKDKVGEIFLINLIIEN